MAESERHKPFWRRWTSFVSESLRDNNEDFTTGPIDRALGLLAISMMLESAMESVFAVVVSESLLTILGVIVFRRGNWKLHAA